VRSAIVREPIDVAAMLREVSHARNGASVLFLGTVREQNDGRPVTGIDYAAYEAMAPEELARIVREAAVQFGTGDIVAEHRIGRLEIGAISVAIAAAHPHRADAYDASRYVIEQIKRRLPIWKREEYVDGTREWVGQLRESGIGNRESDEQGFTDSHLVTSSRDSRFLIPDSRP
jgi:molybdopterin synthase catalytic subunit